MTGAARSPGLVPLILSGGSGRRLWPLSRREHPKQFHRLWGEGSMLQQTARRLTGDARCGPPLVLCNLAHRFFVAEHLHQVGIAPRAIILEPEGRNTAPAAAVGALAALEEDPEAVLVVAPSDHVIRDGAALARALARAAGLARQGWLVTFGVPPRRPETGYGYIRPRRDRALGNGAGAWEAGAFIEKPDADTARRFLDEGGYYWNSGIFVFRAATYLEALEGLEPELYAGCRRAWRAARRDLDFLRLGEEAFRGVPDLSIDKAVMERTDRVAMVPLDAGWSDVGSWDALWEVGARDARGNAIHGDALVLGTENSIVQARDRLVAAVGVRDLIIVETADAVLVAHRNAHQAVGDVAGELMARGREEGVHHRRVYRPWGCFENIQSEGGFKVKRLIINPGARLSLQLHRRRAEHWVVVRGRALIRRGDESFVLNQDQSTYIPVGTRHQIENPETDTPLEIIEVQTGDYLGEDDIVRFQDDYGRADGTGGG